MSDKIKRPDVSKWKLCSFDTETADPNLFELGPGDCRHDGRLMGFSISDGNFSEYYDLSHTGGSLEDQANNKKYLQDILKTSINFVGANLKYDIGWYTNSGYTVEKRKYFDIQIAEPLIDENQRSYSLDNLALKYLDEKKQSQDLVRWCEENVKGYDGKDPRKYIYLMPYEVVRRYGKSDADQPLRIFNKQIEIINKQGLDRVFDLETRLIPFTVMIRNNGARVDESKLQQLDESLNQELIRLTAKLCAMAGKKVSPTSRLDMEAYLKENKIEIERNALTPLMLSKGKTEGNAALGKKKLKKIDDEYIKTVLEIRQKKHTLTNFIEPFKKMLYKGRLHCEYNQLRGDDTGTITGRYSASKPNLQNPSKQKDDSGHKSIRELFIPEPGCDLYSEDLSQIEYRVYAYYAQGIGSEALRQSYRDNPLLDYHDLAMLRTGITNRDEIKPVNFGVVYGIGAEKLSEQTGWPLEFTKAILAQWHAGMPHLKYTMQKVADKAASRGYIITIGGRHSHLTPITDSMVIDCAKRHAAWFKKDFAETLESMRNGTIKVKHPYGYRKLNHLIQGSAADIFKAACVQTYEAGIFGILKISLIVHDEKVVSAPRTKEGREAVLEMKRISESCMPSLTIPIIANVKKGANWGQMEAIA